MLIAEMESKIRIFDIERKTTERRILFQEMKNLQQKFVQDFPIAEIPNLRLYDYAYGNSSKESFCYKLKNDLRILGNMSSHINVFGVYVVKKSKDYQFVKKYGGTLEEAFENLKFEIRELLIAGKDNDRDRIIGNEINNMFKYKLLGAYFPNTFLNIYSHEHLNERLAELNLKFDERNEIYDKQQVLLKFKKQHKICREWNLQEFRGLFYLPKLKGDWEEMPPLEDIEIRVVDFDIENNTSDNLHSKLNLKGNKKPNYREQNDRNNALGERGEKIVLKYEREFLIKEKLSLERLEHSSKYDDRLGYDIKSCDINGNTKFIEVKSTRQKVGNVSLVITQNELDKAKKLKKYCIYVVFEAHTATPAIWKIENFIENIDKIKLIPINYRMEITIAKK